MSHLLLQKVFTLINDPDTYYGAQIVLYTEVYKNVICSYLSSKTVVKEKLPQGCNGVPDPVDMNGYKMNGKKALFDELSIPFIDASPAPSPKPGRSTDR